MIFWVAQYNMSQYCIVLYCIVLYCFDSYDVLVMGVVPASWAMCVYVCSGQSEETGGGHEHWETIP